MTCAQLLNSAGLGLSMVGVIILFCFGPPQPDFEKGVSIGLEDDTPLADGRTVRERNADVRRLRRRYSRLSKLGLALLFAGFALQLWATWA